MDLDPEPFGVETLRIGNALGAVEGDRPTDQPNQGNANAPAIDEEGMPNDPIKICEDVIGANVDGSEGG